MPDIKGLVTAIKTLQKRVDILVDGEIKHKFVPANQVAKYDKQFMRDLTALYYEAVWNGQGSI